MTIKPSDSRRAEERGDYVRHGVITGYVRVIARAIKHGMPIWERGGDVAQLGGEFVLGPGYVDSSVYRTRN